MRRESAAFRSGFTLIEVLTVIAIIGVLMSLLLVSVGAVRRRAGVDHTRSTLLNIGTAINKYHLDFGEYPPGAGGVEGCEELYRALTSTEHSGPYWDKGFETTDTNHNGKPEIVDHWKHPFHYARADSYDFRPPKAASYRIVSGGLDGRSGTDDDIRNWKTEDED